MRGTGRFVRYAHREVGEIRDPKAKSDAASGVRVEVESRRRRLDRKRKDSESVIEATTHIVGSRWARFGWGFLCVSIAEVFADAGSWYVTTVSTMPSLPNLPVLLSSMLVAVVLSGFCHALMSPFLQDPLRVDRTARRHLWVGLTFCGVAALGFFSFWSVRGASPEMAERLMHWDWLSLLCLNVGLPVSAGAFSSLSSYLTASVRAKRRFLSAIDGLTDLSKVDDWLAKQIVKPDEIPTASEEGGAPAVLGTIISRVSRGPSGEAAFGDELKDSSIEVRPQPTEDSSACTHQMEIRVHGDGQSPRTQVTSRKLPRMLMLMLCLLTFQASTAAATERQVDCFIALDESESSSRIQLKAAAEFLRKTTKELVSVYGCTEITISHFSDEGRWAPRVRLMVPTAPPSIDCALAQPRPLEGLKRLYGYFKSVQESERRQAQQYCAANQEPLQAAFHDAWHRFENDLGKSLEQHDGQRGGRTLIRPILQGYARAPRARFAVIVTDGIETPRTRPEDLAVPGTLQVVMLLIPPVGEYGSGAESLVRGEQWERAVPGLKAIPITEAYEGMWRDLAARKGDR